MQANDQLYYTIVLTSPAGKDAKGADGVDAGPHGITVAPDGHVWYTGQGAGEILGPGLAWRRHDQARQPFADEAVADFVALDVYEPVWQHHWLGDSVPLADGLRGRYGGIVMGINWALYEDRILDRNTGQMVNPNMEWYLVPGISDVPVLLVK